MEKEIICTNCPMGCHVTVTLEGDKIIHVTGNTCPRGDAYARAEVTDPRRTITTTVRVSGGGIVSVKSDAALSKAGIPEYLDQIHNIVAIRPVRMGDVLLSDIDGKGTNIIATANVRE